MRIGTSSHTLVALLSMLLATTALAEISDRPTLLRAGQHTATLASLAKSDGLIVIGVPKNARARMALVEGISKYIGETEKNLYQMLHKASDQGLALFFEEAEALFDQRTEVKDSHDRYANQVTSYLLVPLESCDGGSDPEAKTGGPFFAHESGDTVCVVLDLGEADVVILDCEGKIRERTELPGDLGGGGKGR